MFKMANILAPAANKKAGNPGIPAFAKVVREDQIFSDSSLPGLKRATFFALILMVSPV
jgi:hypothetical protein